MSGRHPGRRPDRTQHRRRRLRKQRSPYAFLLCIAGLSTFDKEFGVLAKVQKRWKRRGGKDAKRVEFQNGLPRTLELKKNIRSCR